MPMSADSALQTRASLQRELNVLDGIAIVAGTIIGSAIFIIPSSIAAKLPSPTVVITAWIAGGILSLFGALSLGELGSAYPGAGGIYIYLREAFGSLPAFLYGWGLLSMIHSGSIAALSVGFSIYAARIFILGSMGQKLVSVSCIALLTIINCFGVRPGKLVQNILAIIKVGALLLMVAALLVTGRHTIVPRAPKTGFTFGLVQFGTALTAILWAYEGWHVVSFTAGEMKRPKRDLPLALFYGTLLITAIYLLANVSYYFVLSPSEIRDSSAVAASALSKVYGAPSVQFLSVLILISVLGAMNGMVLTGPRVYYAMAKDGLFFGRFTKTGKYGTPLFALLTQGLWAMILAWSGTYEQLFTYVIFMAWLFYGMTVAGVVILRRKDPNRERPFKVPLYPLIPIVFCIAAAAIAMDMIFAAPGRAAIGITLILTGVPIYVVFQRLNGFSQSKS
jgi:APA family basic amino acid/polyamine antiporter